MDPTSLLLVGAGAYLFYYFVLRGKANATPASSGGSLADVLNKIPGAGTARPPFVGPQIPQGPFVGPVVPEVVDAVKIVKDWQVLREDAESLQLTDAEEQLDEIWKVLNPKVKKA